MQRNVYIKKTRSRTELYYYWVFANFILILVCIALVFLFFFRKNSLFEKNEMAYDGYILQAADRYAVPPGLIKAIIRQESKFNCWARNRRSGAIGLMQIMNTKASPVTEWEQTRAITRPIVPLLYDPFNNIEIGTWYFARALKYWEVKVDDLDVAYQLALAEYNAGRGNALKWMPKNSSDKFNVNNITFKETRHYVKQVMKYWEEDYEKIDNK